MDLRFITLLLLCQLAGEVVAVGRAGEVFDAAVGIAAGVSRAAALAR